MLITVLVVGGVPDLESARITPQTKTLAVTTTAQVREMHVFYLVTQKRVHARVVMSTHSVRTLAAAPTRLIFVDVRQRGAVRIWHAKSIAVKVSFRIDPRIKNYVESDLIPG